MLLARSLLICVGAFIATTACSRRSVSVPAPSNIANPDNSYLDLQPGWTLRVVVPLLKSGAAGPKTSIVQTNGNNFTVQSRDLLGYQTSLYSVERNGKGLRIEFASAEITRDGKTVPESMPPTLPFALPKRATHIRLIYLVRVSQADHNMAIVAAKRLDALNTFTGRLKTGQAICGNSPVVFCSWVPAGVAVRPQQQ